METKRKSPTKNYSRTNNETKGVSRIWNEKCRYM